MFSDLNPDIIGAILSRNTHKNYVLVCVKWKQIIYNLSEVHADGQAIIDVPACLFSKLSALQKIQLPNYLFMLVSRNRLYSRIKLKYHISWQTIIDHCVIDKRYDYINPAGSWTSLQSYFKYVYRTREQFRRYISTMMAESIINSIVNRSRNRIDVDSCNDFGQLLNYLDQVSIEIWYYLFSNTLDSKQILRYISREYVAVRQIFQSCADINTRPWWV